MTTDRKRIQFFAKQCDWRLVEATSTSDRFKLVHTNAVGILARYDSSDRLLTCSLADQRTDPGVHANTESLLTVTVWLEGTGAPWQNARVEELFNHADADGHGFQLERVTVPGMGIEEYHLRVLDSGGGTMAATKMDQHVLDMLARTIREIR